MPDIETLDLSVKSYATIKRMGINTTDELKDRIEDVLLHTQKAGEEAIEKLNALSIVSTEQRKQAFELHYKIISSADTAQLALWDMCKNLKEMRDSKLYKALGYDNFEEYCETEVGLKRRQALKYVAIVENVDIKNVQSTAHLGTEKLYLLSTIDKEQQHELSEKVNLEETTVKQLKAEIDKLKNEQKNYEQLVEEINADKLKAEKRADEAEFSKKLTQESYKRLEQVNHQHYENFNAEREKNRLLNDEIKQLESENEELRSHPVEVAVVDNSAENDRKLNEVIRSLERENMKRNEELEQQYREDEKAVRKMLEKDKQKALSELREEYEKKLAEQSKAAPADENTQRVEAYCLNLYETFESLIKFVKAHKRSKSYDDFCRKIDTMIDTFTDLWEEI